MDDDLRDRIVTLENVLDDLVGLVEDLAINATFEDSSDSDRVLNAARHLKGALS